jgi:SAM-dependent methyltransferase
MLQKLRTFFRLANSRDPRARIALRERLLYRPSTAWIVRLWDQLRARVGQRDAAGYLKMQKSQYELFASADHVTPGCIQGDFVAGSWQEHDQWPDYEEYLMRHVPREAGWVALEYGCGPGRNLRRWSSWFKRIDGVDISAQNLANARAFVSGVIPADKQPNLYLTAGSDCGDAPPGAYDFAFSTICLQHICVHEVRRSIFASIFRCLRAGGRFSAQMGYGVPSPRTVPYDANYYQAAGTNRECDVAVGSPEEIQRDLAGLGFVNFESWIRPVGPGDCHPNWIFFTATKP